MNKDNTKSNKRPNQKVRDTSKKAFHELTKKQLKTEAGAVYLFIKEHGPCSRQMIVEGTKIPINHITRAVTTIRDVWNAVEEPFTAKCKVTGKTVNYLQIIAK